MSTFVFRYVVVLKSRRPRLYWSESRWTPDLTGATFHPSLKAARAKRTSLKMWQTLQIDKVCIRVVVKNVSPTPRAK